MAERETQGDSLEYYYMIQSKRPNSSMWHTVHTFDDLVEFLRERQELDYGHELTIVRKHGWDEVERKEYLRLKEKYEGKK